jgi:hypothetical protein
METEVSEEHIASVFRVEKSTREEQFASQLLKLFLAFLYPEDEGDTFLRNVGSHKTYTAPHPRTRHSS